MRTMTRAATSDRSSNNTNTIGRWGTLVDWFIGWLDTIRGRKCNPYNNPLSTKAKEPRQHEVSFAAVEEEQDVQETLPAWIAEAR
jgi:hypothetical protein